ncbi:MAG: GNAT family N-acetyltransferase [Flavonifractor plautii]
MVPPEVAGGGEAVFEGWYQPVYRAERGYQYAICLKEDDIPIGYIKVDLDESHDLGYGLRHEFWHRGIAAGSPGPGRAGEAGRAALSPQPLTM